MANHRGMFVATNFLVEDNEYASGTTLPVSAKVYYYI